MYRLEKARLEVVVVVVVVVVGLFEVVEVGDGWWWWVLPVGMVGGGMMVGLFGVVVWLVGGGVWQSLA